MLAAGRIRRPEGMHRNDPLKSFSGKAFSWGLTSTPLAVDHRIYGSVAFLIEAKARLCLYTAIFAHTARQTRDDREFQDG